jgi:MFS family permease
MVSGRRRFAVFMAMSLLYFLLMAGTFNSLGMVLPAMVKEFGMSWAQGGFGFTLLGTACGIVSLAPALLIRRIGVSKTLLAGALMLLAGFGLLFAAHGVLGYYAGTTLLGLGFCFCGTVPGVHVLSSSFERRSTALGVYYTIGSLGAVAGPLFFYFAQAEAIGWRNYWLLFALGTVVVGGFGALVTRGTDSAREETAAIKVASPDEDSWTIPHALRSVQFWIIVFAYTACLVVNTTTHSFAYQHLLETGHSAELVTQLLSLSALIAAIGATCAGLAGEKLSSRVMVLLALGGMGLSSVALAVGQGEAVLTVFVVASGIGLAFNFVSTAMMLQQYFGQRASLELYSIMTAISTSAALGPAAGGLIRDQSGSFAGIFYALGAINLLLFVVVVAMRKPVRRAEAALAFTGAPVPPEIGIAMVAGEN